MAIEHHIKQGDALCALKDFDGAVACYNRAIVESPRAFAPFWKRAAAYQKLHRFSDAEADLSVAFSIARDRGSRAHIGLCHYRLGLLKYLEHKLPEAAAHFAKATDHNCDEPALHIWKAKCDKELATGTSAEAAGVLQDVPDKTAGTSASAGVSVEASIPDKTGAPILGLPPGRPRIKDDWYQLDKAVFIAIYAKKVDPAAVTADFSPHAVHVSFPVGAGSEYVYAADPLFAAIDATASKYTVYGTKIEIELAKASPAHWLSLHGEHAPSTAVEGAGAAHVYPTSSKKGTDWGALRLDDDDAAECSDPEDFFNKLYKDVDDDARRAIRKSYIESNGTVLTTNWDEARRKTFDTAPPQGMVPKRWGT